MRNLSIRTKFFILIIVIFVPLIILYISRIITMHTNNVDRELEANRQLVEAISTSFTGSVDEIWTQESMLNMIFMKNADMSRNEIQYYLNEALRNQHTAEVFTWVGADGTVIASTNEDLIGSSVAHREYFKNILKGHEKVISEQVIGMSSNKPVIPIARAARKDGKLYGAMIVIIDGNKLGEELPNPSVISGRRFGIVDSKGNKVFQSDMLNKTSDSMQISSDSPIWRALQGETVKETKRLSGFDKTKRIGVYIPIESIGWACFVTSPYDSVMVKYNQQLYKEVVILIAVALWSLLMSFSMGNNILSRIHYLKEAANLLVDGNYSARTNIFGNDEIAVTAQAFDQMAEGIEQYDKLKTQFFVNLTHELKTPINVIFASIQLISQAAEGKTEEELKVMLDKHAKMVKQNCYRLLRLVNNLIDISKYDNGFLNLKFNRYNIVQVVEDVTLSIVKYAEMKDIEVVFDTDIEEKYIVCDPDAIERVMLNLFSNSLKFTNEKGKILVNIYDSTDGVEISVKDTGIGIPEDKLNLIFERFRQVDDSLYRNNEGSGIGLSLVKALIESHKGTITAASIEGEGTEFLIQLPTGVMDEDSRLDTVENSKPQGSIDRINIEFSDIYSLSETKVDYNNSL